MIHWTQRMDQLMFLNQLWLQLQGKRLFGMEKILIRTALPRSLSLTSTTMIQLSDLILSMRTQEAFWKPLLITISETVWELIVHFRLEILFITLQGNLLWHNLEEESHTTQLSVVLIPYGKIMIKTVTVAWTKTRPKDSCKPM